MDFLKNYRHSQSHFFIIGFALLQHKELNAILSLIGLPNFIVIDGN